MIFAYILFGVATSFVAAFVLGLFMLSSVKLYFRDYIKIMMEEKTKAYAALLDGFMGKMTVQAIESMGTSDSSKPN